MADGKIVIYTTNNIQEAELIKQLLNNYGINAFLLNKMDSAYHFGEIEIIVDKDDVIKAKKFIQDFKENE